MIRIRASVLLENILLRKWQIIFSMFWHGGMNLLGKEDILDNVMRIKSAQVAEELLEISM